MKMKTLLKLIALSAAAGMPCVAFAQVAGAPLPAVINLESAFAAFAFVFAALTAVRDYARVSPALIAPEAPRVSAAAHDDEPRRTRAYGIRRGADVAQLAR